jgi:hypothetical protein
LKWKNTQALKIRAFILTSRLATRLLAQLFFSCSKMLYQGLLRTLGSYAQEKLVAVKSQEGCSASLVRVSTESSRDSWRKEVISRNTMVQVAKAFMELSLLTKTLLLSTLNHICFHQQMQVKIQTDHNSSSHLKRLHGWTASTLSSAELKEAKTSLSKCSASQLVKPTSPKSE